MKTSAVKVSAMKMSAVKSRVAQAGADGERGSAMMGAIGVMAVGLIISSLLLSSVVNGLSFTSSVRAGVQSQASADAGLAVAQLSLLKGTCVSDTASGDAGRFTSVDPEYDVQVQYLQASGSYTNACPPNTNADVRIESHGSSVTPGVLSARGNASTVEAVFASTAIEPTTLTPGGPAIFAYSSTGFAGSGSLVSVDGSEPSVMIKTGNTACSGGSDGARDWVVEGGSLTTSGSCTVAGTVWATGTVTNGSATGIGGNVIASAYTSTNSGPVGGNVWVTGPAVLDNGGSLVKGNVIAGSIAVNGGKINGSAWSKGALSVAGGGRVIAGNTESATLSVTNSGQINGNSLVYGAATVNKSKVLGKVTAKSLTLSGGGTVGSKLIVPAGPAAGPAPVAAPATPIVPNWIDFTYKVTDWPGYSVVTLSGDCRHVWYPLANPIKAAIEGFTSPGVVDARGCTHGVLVEASYKFDLKHDLVIVANNFDLQGGGGFTSTGDNTLWLIQPDTVADLQPTCAGRKFIIGGGFTFTTNISTMIYTPCFATMGSTHWRGQLFAGQTSLAGAAELGFVAIGLPGYNMTTGAPIANDAETAASMYDQATSLRNLSTND
jgi:hypothetical protein